MTTTTCARCGQSVAVDDLITVVRRVTRIRPDNTITHDRGDAVAHLTCEAPNLENRSQ